jgi:hypothetical protein
VAALEAAVVERSARRSWLVGASVGAWEMLLPKVRPAEGEQSEKSHAGYGTTVGQHRDSIDLLSTNAQCDILLLLT